jgi:hypothetical protein
MSIKNLFIALVATSLISCKKQPERIEQMETFADFKKRLDIAIKKQDTLLLAELLYDTVFESNDICGYPGCPKGQFFKFYFNHGNRDWDLLRDQVQFGFAKVAEPHILFKGIDSVYQAPNHAVGTDTRREVLIIFDSVNLYSQPYADSLVIDRLEKGMKFACVCCSYGNNGVEDDLHLDDKNELWVRIRDNHRVGYVRGDSTSLRSFRDFRVALIRGRWRIISWYAGECG